MCMSNDMSSRPDRIKLKKKKEVDIELYFEFSISLKKLDFSILIYAAHSITFFSMITKSEIHIP